MLDLSCAGGVPRVFEQRNSYWNKYVGKVVFVHTTEINVTCKIYKISARIEVRNF
jgi:hypothetical protein